MRGRLAAAIEKLGLCIRRNAMLERNLVFAHAVAAAAAALPIDTTACQVSSAAHHPAAAGEDDDDLAALDAQPQGGAVPGADARTRTTPGAARWMTINSGPPSRRADRREWRRRL